MAAPANGSDCVHLSNPGLNGHLSDLKLAGGIKSCRFISVVGETLSSDKAEVPPQNGDYFARGETIDCVFLQLWKNGQDTTAFSSDYSDQIGHIVEMVPNVSITTVHDLWKNDDNNTAKKTVIENKDDAYADLDAIQNSSDNKAWMGAEVKGDAGRKHAIDHEDVANHADDFGMK